MGRVPRLTRPAARPPRDEDTFEVIWRPHRDAPSLIPDLHGPRSVFRGSQLATLHHLDGSHNLLKAITR